MPNEPQDWTQWIILTLTGAIGSTVAALVFLTKFIGNKYVSEIIELKNELKTYRDAIDELRKESIVCYKSREELNIRIAVLEAEAYKREHKSLNRSERLSDRLSDLEHGTHDEITRIALVHKIQQEPQE